MAEKYREIECDILVLGGGLGGVAAALRAARSGYRVCLTEENYWIGGQCTSQGVSALDENQYIETFSGTASYYEFRDQIRAIYRANYELSNTALKAPFLNPGGGWVSRLCFEPRVGLGALLHLILPEVEGGRLQLFYRARVQGATMQDGAIRTVAVDQGKGKTTLRFHPTYVLDATELGDLLPLLGLSYSTGAEAREQTGEPHARVDGAAPELVQTFTYPFVVDFCPGEDHTIPRPPNYEYHRDRQPYTLTLRYGCRDLTYKVFEDVADLPGAFWTYRRIFAADYFSGSKGDLAMINWTGNDFRGGNIIDKPRAVQVPLLQAAKDLSLGLLHWLQTEVPRDDGSGYGYPELRLRTDVLGTADGLSQYPYIRESRRILAHRTVVEQDVAAAFQHQARAAFCADSVGLGHYPIDIHGMPGEVAARGPTKPFQIPLAALVPRAVDNLLAACKNIGTTHITNGCFRLHPIEWNIGEAAGALAAFCLEHRQKPAAVCENAALRLSFQRELLCCGVPLYWYEDVPLDHPAFAASQLLAQENIFRGGADHLCFGPDENVTEEEKAGLLEASRLDRDAVGADAMTRADLARAIAARRFSLAS